MKKRITHSVKLTRQTLEVDGKRVAMAVEGESFLTSLYHAAAIEYPKFFKMDLLCKVGFIASEYLLNAEGKERFQPADDRAVLLFNRNSSWNADTTFQQTIVNPEEFYPSPAKLPSGTNIMARATLSSCRRCPRLPWNRR